jgi:hypothetical protein
MFVTTTCCSGLFFFHATSHVHDQCSLRSATCDKKAMDESHIMMSFVLEIVEERYSASGLGLWFWVSDFSSLVVGRSKKKRSEVVGASRRNQRARRRKSSGRRRGVSRQKMRLISRTLALCAGLSGVVAMKKNRPIAKVIKLLEDMKAQLEKEAADDAEVYDKLTCWYSFI